MGDLFSRTENLIGSDALIKLKNSTVALFGLGGVGSFVAEALARTGIGRIYLFDCDKVDSSNINRQLIATSDNVGRIKTEVTAERLKSIIPDIKIEKYNVFVNKEFLQNFDFTGIDYIVDAIDTVTSKLELIALAKAQNIPIISCMGTGNKLDPTKLTVSDISKTKICPLARVMRYELKKRGIEKVKVVWSAEEPQNRVTETLNGKNIPASCVFVPASAGLLIASEVVRDIIKKD